MIKNFFAALFIVIVLAVIPAGGYLLGLNALFTVVLPYSAVVVFLAGFIYRILLWARTPEPFRIPTTCGQEKSLPWIRRSRLESPFTGLEAVGRMALEIVLFRSLFRNSRMELIAGRPVYSGAKWLWLFGLMFHISFLVLVLRHLRFFTEPVLSCVNGLATLDGIFEIGVPALYLTDVFFLLGVGFLLLRRTVIPKLRYLSLVSDYFAVLLLIAIAGSGLLMRHFYPVDIQNVKTLALGWVTFAPTAAAGIGALFFVHLFLICVLIIWFPFSKLMHMAGVFLSPTRNLANNSRARRHMNPWNAPIKVHTYEEYEDEFREQMLEAGLPVEHAESVKTGATKQD